MLNIKTYKKAQKNNWLFKCNKHMKQVKPRYFWDSFDNCLEDALKYNTKIEWKNNNNSAYNSARCNDWLDECCKHMKK